MNGTNVKDKNKFINLLFRRGVGKAEIFKQKAHFLNIQEKFRRKLIAESHENPVSDEEVKQLRSNGLSYLGIFSGISNYSKAIDLKKYSDCKVGRPRKHKNDMQFYNSRKQRRKTQKRCDSDLIKTFSTESFLRTRNVLESLSPTTSMTEALDIVENRRKSIKAKLNVKKEHLLTQEEEQDIHSRADIYAITTIPDPQFYVLPQNDEQPRPVVSVDESEINTVFPAVKKRRRRNYGNSNCFVAYHNNDDIYDNTRMLPIGTRLLKPPTKLVELVAQAIDGSPDGLLQVQQIYTYLQNKYPFFRYMEITAVNSWRSSVRHALYQKWFRKIPFDLNYISCKGCYWAINHTSNPKEWTMPENTAWENTDDDCYSVCASDIDNVTHTDILALLQDEKSDGDSTESVLAIAREFGIELEETDTNIHEDKSVNETEGQVRESDPVLATCAPGPLNEDVYLSSTESPGNGSSSPLAEKSPVLQGTCAVLPDLMEYFSNTPENEFHSPVHRRNNALHRVTQMEEPKSSLFSPIVNWTPNWDEYGNYILSPQSLSSHQNWFGVEMGKVSEQNNGVKEKWDWVDSQSNFKSVIDDINSILVDSPSPNVSMSTSDTASEIEVIAEFTKPSSDISDDDLDFDLNEL